MAISLLSCSKEETGSKTYTLMTGVSVTEVSACSDKLQRGIFVSKGTEKSEYLVGAADAFSCESKIHPPFLTVTKDKRATLVLTSDTGKSDCECLRTISMKLSGRMEAGDTLYVVNSSEVMGHVVLP